MRAVDGFLSLFSPDRKAAISNSRELQDELLKGQAAATGASVNESSAMRVGAIYGCVKVLAESIASIPLHVYRKLDSWSKEKAVDHPLYPLLHSQSNDLQSSYEWRETMAVHVLLQGNHVSIPVVSGDNRILELLPILPGQVKIERDPKTQEVVYNVTPESGGRPIPYRRSEVFHLKGLSSDGWKGRSVLSDAREAFGMGIAEQEFAGRFFSNRANHGLVVMHPKEMSEPAYKRLEESLNNRTTELGNAWRTLILEEGVDLKTVSMTLEDAQFIEGRQFTVTDICRIFRVPPHMVFELSRATFSNIEQQSLEFAIYSLRPWLVRIEQAINMQLLGINSGYYAEFNMEALLRGDAQSQANALATEIMNGMITPNEVRALKNRNPYPYEWANRPWMPTNLMQPGSQGVQQ